MLLLDFVQETLEPIFDFIILILQLLLYWELLQLLLLAHIQFLIEYLNLHLQLFIYFLQTLFSIDLIGQIYFNLIKIRHQISRMHNRFCQAFLCHTQFFAFEVSLVIQSSNFNMKILIYSSQILKLCFGIFQLWIKPNVFVHTKLLIWLLTKSILFVLGLEQLVLFLNCVIRYQQLLDFRVHKL